MAKVITFQGKTHTFPDDATDDEIRAALESSPVSAALEATGYDKTKPVPEASWFEKPMVAERNFPSPEWLVDSIPGVTGALGAVMGGPPGAAGHRRPPDLRFRG